MKVEVVENDDRSFSVVPVFQWDWERAGWSESEEAQEGIFTEEFRTSKRAIREAELEGFVVNIF